MKIQFWSIYEEYRWRPRKKSEKQNKTKQVNIDIICKLVKHDKFHMEKKLVAKKLVKLYTQEYHVLLCFANIEVLTILSFIETLN